tara:strand:- start:2048 stop:2716 length:669 start_codon:yes stop_codon:yes gene_type:complete
MHKRKGSGGEKSEIKKVRLDEINFNSKISTPNGYRKLSNLFDAEFDYMRARFPQAEMQALFDELKVCDEQTFMRWLKLLQPGKKWTEKKERYWFFEGEPIRGILAQMIGSCVRTTASASKRQRILCKKLGIESIEVNPELTDDGKKDLMLTCLRMKYARPEYRTLLLSTGDAILHEIPLRGKPNVWSFRNGEGGNWLGQLLMQVRREIRAGAAGETKVQLRM